MTDGDLTLCGAHERHLDALLAVLRDTGATIIVRREIRVGGTKPAGRYHYRSISGLPHRFAGTIYGDDVYSRWSSQIETIFETDSCMCRNYCVWGLILGQW